MVTHALQRRAVPRVGSFLGGWTGTAVLLAVLLAVSLFSRTRALDGPFWIDEGLSVGIASFPFSQIPEVLRQDGSPPLYYLLLHAWTDVFGSSEAATHALSLGFALLAVPAALWAGWTLFGRNVAWIAAALVAVNPFLTVYAQETRMYSLVILLSVLATAAFVHAFVFRRRRYVPFFALVLTLMLYVHNWALFFALGAAVAVAFTARETRERRKLVLDAALAFATAALLYAPWVPTLVYQALHTGAPWSKPPSPRDLVAAMSAVLSGQGALVAFLLAAGTALLGSILRDEPSRERTAVIALLALAAGTLFSGWLYSQISPAWAIRYLGILLGPLLLLAGVGIARAGRLGLVALTIVLLFWVPFRANGEKSNARELAARFDTYLAPGDVVLSTQPEQVPVLAYYFRSDVRWATPLGRVSETRVMDWRDAVSRLRAARPRTELEPLLDDMPVGSHVMLIRPVVRNEDAWTAEWTSLVRRRSGAWARALARDRRFELAAAAVPSYASRVVRPLRADLFTKVARAEAP
ncbi:MAG: glycosyltransferase family 39 protein [Actinomycetota bacterium]|nr:glycosyltransferase family 39 protein [Actinomycetota bacterium]